MADQQQSKSPEELGEAVAQKIEALFGGFFADEEPKPAEERPATDATQPLEPQPSFEATQPLDLEAAFGLVKRATGRDEMPRPEPASHATPPRKPAPARGPSRTPSMVVPAPQPPPQARGETGRPFDEIADRVEALILNLEWEVSPQTIVEIGERFRELEPYFPGDKTARSVIAMNNRVLQRFKAPDSSPHPAVVKMLTDSALALKTIRNSPEKRASVEPLIQGINAMYKEITAGAPARAAERSRSLPPRSFEAHRTTAEIPRPTATVPRSTTELRRAPTPQQPSPVAPRPTPARPPAAAPPQRPTAPQPIVAPQPVPFEGPSAAEAGTGVKNVALAQAIEAVAERLMQLVDALRHGEPLPLDATAGKTAADGLLTFVWSKTPLAVPSSIVVAVYPVTKAQADQFKDKSAIIMGSRTLQRLPLKKPPAAEKFGEIVPTCLVHLTWNRADYFLLADKSLGFHRPPPGVDVTSESKVKLGATVFSVLNQSTLR